MKEYWISTYTGKKFDYIELAPEQFDIADVARALSYIPRYCGQLDKFYSVAEHSVNVCSLVKTPRAKYWGLMHDAAEAYFGDVPSPFKWLVPQIKKVENKIQEAMIKAFDIPYDKNISAEVKKADQTMLMTENKQLRSNQVDWHYYEGIKEANFKVVGLASPEAEKLFLNTFHEIRKEILIKV